MSWILRLEGLGDGSRPGLSGMWDPRVSQVRVGVREGTCWAHCCHPMTTRRQNHQYRATVLGRGASETVLSDAANTCFLLRSTNSVSLPTGHEFPPNTEYVARKSLCFFPWDVFSCPFTCRVINESGRLVVSEPRYT